MKTGGGVARSLCPKRPGLSSTPCRPQTYTLWHCISLPHCFCDKEKGRKGVSWAGSPAWSQAQGGGEGNKRTWDQRSWSGFGAGLGSAALFHPPQLQAGPAMGIPQLQILLPTSLQPYHATCGTVEGGHFNGKIQRFDIIWSPVTTFASARSPATSPR